ncbi:MAG: glycosyltransferase family 2 protein [bacterium]
MIKDKKIAVILPAYNAEKTLEKTYNEIPHDIVDYILLVDDHSNDRTLQIAQKLNIDCIRHPKNLGYGGNQKTCYHTSYQWGADIIVMLHPDYQYTPRLLRAMVSLIAEEVYPVVLGSRILGKGAIDGGMPRYKYIANRFLTFVENLLIGQKLSEYHTGYRAFDRRVFDTIRIEDNSNDFIFDNEMLVQCHVNGFSIGEISCPTKYFKEASSISFWRSMKYGFGCLWVAIKCFLHRNGIIKFQQFMPKSKVDEK